MYVATKTTSRPTNVEAVAPGHGYTRNWEKRQLCEVYARSAECQSTHF